MTEPDPPTPPARGGTAARAAVTSALRAVRPDGLTYRRVRPFVFRSDSRPVVLGGPADPDAPEAAGPPAPRPFVPAAQWPGGDGAQFPPGARIVAVTSTAAGGLGPDRAAVLAACAEPVTVGDVAAALGLRIDVVCLLVADLAAGGHLAPAEG